MSKITKTLLITSALPYANGPIHLGHLVEYIQTDIWVRFQRMYGHTCYYVCADDAHGTPVMLRAQAEQISPEALIERVSREHQADFADFSIDFDCFHNTHSPENRRLCQMIYERLRQAGHISKRTIKQAFDPEQSMFLPDRFIRGGCPQCGAADQYGDSCEQCGATYSPADLVNPVSAISGARPVERESEHYFFNLADFEDFLQDWILGDQIQPEIRNKLNEWLTQGLQAWDISRDTPYFGFEIPDAPGKYFYVWLDAPIGYLASLQRLCEQKHLDFNRFVKTDSDVEMHHFIGKDIVYFHALFWPAILRGSGMRTPTRIYAHGFLTVNGEKMSKSRGTFIQARTYLEHLQPEYLRYYFAAKLGSGVDDIDLNLSDFVQRVNADLVGKLINIASRCAGFITQRCAGKLGDSVHQPKLMATLTAAGDSIAAAYAGRHYARAVREIMALADQVNQYIDQHKPWVLAKQADKQTELQAVCTMGLNCFRILIIYLKPVLPTTAKQVEAFLNIPALAWEDRQTVLLAHEINPFKPLITRIKQKQVQAMVEASREVVVMKEDSNNAENPVDESVVEPIASPINVNDFAKLDLRVAKITQAVDVEGADKLLRLTLDLGGETRQVLAGIKAAYKPKALEGQYTVMVANLPPRKMRFGVSEGMVLAAGPGGKEVFILHPDKGAKAGMRVK